MQEILTLGVVEIPTEEQKGPHRLMTKIPRSADHNNCTSTGSKETKYSIDFSLFDY